MARRKKKKRGHGLIIIEIILALIIILILAGVAAYYFCPLKNVTVEGTDLYTDDEIKGYILDDEYSVNTVYVFLKNKLFPKDNAQFIESFDVEIKDAHSINIVCNEKTILGYIANEDGTYIYFDYNGIIAEISDIYIDGYMRVEGVVSEDAAIGDLLNIGEDEVGYLTSLIKLLQKLDIIPHVISYDDNKEITLKYDTYDIVVGSSAYLEEKIDRLEYILPQIEGMSGTLHLENYSNENTDIVFEKAAEAQE